LYRKPGSNAMAALSDQRGGAPMLQRRIETALQRG
jgi:hypothetical protein